MRIMGEYEEAGAGFIPMMRNGGKDGNCSEHGRKDCQSMSQ